MILPNRFNNASNHYSKFGYTQLETPWIVQAEAYNATKPKMANDFYTLGGYLVASGEQGFLQMMLDGHALTKHYTITPCFRVEKYDQYHHPYFTKMELIDTNITQRPWIKVLLEMLDQAESFYKQYLEINIVSTNETDCSYDINSKSGIELGSYGIRYYKSEDNRQFSWVYGTGLAEPRLTEVLK